MANSPTFVTSYEDVEFLGGTQTREVQVGGYLTAGHGIYFEVRVPLALFQSDGAQVLAAAALSYQTIYDALADEQYVAGVQWGQEQDGSQLADVAIITVTSSSGNSQSSFTTKLTTIGPQLDRTEIDTLHSHLNALEAG